MSNSLTNGADRKNEGKPQMSLVMQGLMEGVSRVSAFGIGKYSRNNYRKGFPDSGLMDCAQRHLVKYMNGEEFDQESGLCHLDHAAWNVGALLEQRRIRLEGGTCGVEDLIEPMREIRVAQGLQDAT